LESELDIVMGSVLQFVPVKHYNFKDPKIQIELIEELEEYKIILQAAAYAKDVFLELKHCDGFFQDNWFDIHGEQKVTIKLPKHTLIKALSLEELKDELEIMSVYDIGK
jgi:beta-mannosidase